MGLGRVNKFVKYLRVLETLCKMGAKVPDDGDEGAKKSDLRRIVGAVLGKRRGIYAEHRYWG